jgi:3-ketosteroid 9alpha-monooxygenase subunit A
MMIEVPDYNLGPFEFPRGWFMLGSSEELSGSTPKTLHYFGKDMVFYRGETGTPHLVHAYCPHMGAHLGKNSTSYIVRDGEQVQGDSIRCPFHGWRFDATGKCDHVPYAKKGYVPPQAQLPIYKVVERAGIVWMWHDPEGLEPDRDLPAFEQWDQEEEGWVRWGIDNYDVLNIHPVEVVDNMADFGHMMPIHGSIEPAYFDNVFDGRKVVQRFDAGHRTLVGEHGSVLSLDTWYDGPSILQSRMIGEYPSHMRLDGENPRRQARHARATEAGARLPGRQPRRSRAGRGNLGQQRSLRPADADSVRRSVFTRSPMVQAIL